jgi:ring-1,2-phenylacetyl-CoA epoxidase subunit PaaA
MVRVCKEESFHQRQGFDIMTTLCRGTPEQKQMAQDALNRWGWPSIAMHGPADEKSVNSAQSMAWKIKLHSNDELRQKFIDQTVPQAEFLGLTIPDADLQWNEARGHYDYGAIDWDDFYNVVRGNGPCNHERLAARNKAWDEGAWFREALQAYGEQQRTLNEEKKAA